MIQRALGTAVHATERNQVLHMDYLHMSDVSDVDDTDEFHELLVLKDDLSHYCELIPAKSPDAETAVNALLDLFSRFGVPSLLVSDGPTHFKNKVIKSLVERMTARHHFTTPHCPWANGSVERLNQDILQVMRALLSEYRLLPRQWCHLRPLVQMSLNHTLVASLGNRAPITVFTGLPASNPLDVVFLPTKTISDVRLTADQVAVLSEKLRTSMQSMHKDMDVERSKRDVGDVGDVVVDFKVGDYVLWAKLADQHKKYQDKLHAKWYGPMRVVDAISPWVYEIEDLITKVRHQAHVKRLKYYIDSSLHISEEVETQVKHDNGQYDVKQIVDHRCANSHLNKWELLVQWEGYAGEDSWEPVVQLYRDAPNMVKAYVKQLSALEIAHKIVAQIRRNHPAVQIDMPSAV